MPRAVVSLDFFDIPVMLEVEGQDAQDAIWFFRKHLADSESPTNGEHGAHALRVTCSPGFFGSLLAKSPDEKWIRLEDGLGTGTVRFSSWSAAPSFLPPFASEQFKSRYAVVHGSAVTTPTGLGVVIVGNNYVGKTATTLELLCRGWGLVSDSCVIMDYRCNGPPMLRRYETPLGLRRATITRWSRELAQVDSRSQISRDTGQVILAHAADLIPSLKPRDHVQVAMLVALGGSAETESAAQHRPAIVRAYPQSAARRVIAALNCARRYVLDSAGLPTVASVADSIECLARREL